MRKTLTGAITVSIVFILVIFAVACGGGGSTTKTYKVKENAVVGKGTWKIDSVSKSKELIRTDGNGKYSAEGMFILLEVELKNDGSETANLTGGEIEIMDGNRNSYSFDSKNNNIYLGAINKVSLTKDPVPAGETRKGWLIFDINKDAKDLKAKVKDINITGREFAYIDLNI